MAPTNQLNNPYIDPTVNDPRAHQYQQMLAASMQDNQLGIAPSVPIPPLDRNMPEGFTPAQIAMRERTQNAPVGGIFGEAQAPQRAATPNILPHDLLPEVAKQDPTFARNATGNMYAMYQPHLAMRYGVVRNGVHVPPQALSSGPDMAQGQERFKQSTIAGVQSLNQALAAQQQPQSAPMLQELPTDNAASAAAIGNAPGDNASVPVTDDERERARKVLECMDDFDLYQFKQTMMRDVLNNKEQRKAVESRLEPLDITTLIMTNTITQVVPIIPGKFEPEFEVVNIETELALKALIAEESRSMDVSEQYYLDKYSMFALTAGLKAINKIPLPDYKNDKGIFDKDKFQARLRKVLQFPLPMMASLGVNYFWFDIRVRELFSAVLVKNG